MPAGVPLKDINISLRGWDLASDAGTSLRAITVRVALSPKCDAGAAGCELADRNSGSKSRMKCTALFAYRVNPVGQR